MTFQRLQAEAYTEANLSRLETALKFDKLFTQLHKPFAYFRHTIYIYLYIYVILITHACDKPTSN